MRHLGTIGGPTVAILMAWAGAATAQEIPNLKGTWVQMQSASIMDGPNPHLQSGADILGNSSYRRLTAEVTYQIEGQDGRTFWGVVSTPRHSEQFIGTLSVDGKRIVLVDSNGQFDGTMVDTDTIDYCYRHITPSDRTVDCALLVREK